MSCSVILFGLVPPAKSDCSSSLAPHLQDASIYYTCSTFFFFWKLCTDLTAEASFNNLLGKINSSEGVRLVCPPQPSGADAVKGSC